MLTIVVAALAMILAAIRPAKTREWMWIAAGAAAILILGGESVHAAVVALAMQWNVLLFILGLMLLSAVAEESGAFRLVAEFALHHGAGSLRRLFVLLFSAGALLTMALSNDATAIVLTPIVYRAVSSRGGDPLPFLFGCAFVANTASFGLPFSNPANVIVLPRPDVVAYLEHLAVPQIAAIGINLAIFLVVFRKALRGRYEPYAVEEEPSPAAARTLVAACSVALAYVVALFLKFPLGPVALGGALVTLAVSRAEVAGVGRRVSWSTLVLLGALFVLVDALAHAGLFAWSVHALRAAANDGLEQAAAAETAAAGISMLLNNLPVAVCAAYVVAHLPSARLAYALIAGIDVGPNLSTTGSLATIIWLTTLQRYGVAVSSRQYLGLGLLVVPPVLALTLLWIWLLR